MTKLSLVRLFASTVLVSSALCAHAYVTPSAPPPPPIPGAPGQGLYEGVAQLNQITRKGGGQWYRVSLRRPLSLNRVEVSVLRASVKIHEVSIVTERQTRMSLRALSNTPVVSSGQVIASEDFYLNERVSLVDIRAESFGATSDILIHALSQEGTPDLIVVDLAPPPPVRPQPPVRPEPPPSYGTDLGGYCRDVNHTQFYEAKNFAYSPQGLNMNQDQATQWALNYNNTHACGTISEYSARFTILRGIAYSPEGFNMTGQDAARWALQLVEYTGRPEAQQMEATIKAIRSFAYSPRGLNMSSQEAGSLARRWVENRCEGTSLIRDMQARFEREYDFAYSPQGLNMTREEATRYAINRVGYMSRCGYLLAR